MKYNYIILTILFSKNTFGQTYKFIEVANYYKTENNFNGSVIDTNGQIVNKYDE